MKNKVFNGLLLVDKPSGISSHDVVARLRRILKTKAVGHSGTLDPLASGLMACLINEGTKLSQYILEGDKGYRVKFKLGLTTDTLDITGKILTQHSGVDVSVTRLQELAASLVGEFEFEVPIYSAIKVQGKKLYEYARGEQEVQVPKKKMKFWDVQMLSFDGLEAEFDLKCSKGSYIRTWVDELGRLLEVGAAMTELRRTWSQPYRVEAALTLEQIEDQVATDQVGTAFVPMHLALPLVKSVRIKGYCRTLLANGQISHDLRSQLITAFKPSQDQYIQVIDQEMGHLMALVGVEEGRGLVLKRVFKYE